LDTSMKLTREQLLEILYGVAYNIDGSVVKDTEKIRNYTIEVIDGKVHIKTFNVPVQILVDGEWKNVKDVVAEEDLGLLYDIFQEVHMNSEIILDTDDPTGISVRSRERVPNLPNQMAEAGIQYPREFTWVDGASNISGVIILPQDDYDKVFIATDPDDDGNPDIVFIPPKTEENQERPYYEKKDGKTYIYVNHFSGGGGTQAYPYLVENEDDLDNVRNNLGAYYVQTADILMTKFQTGQGFAPIKNFGGYYDGRGFEIKDLYMNRSENYVGLFGNQTGGIIKRVKLVNATIKASGYDYVGAVAGRSYGQIYDCAVVSGTVEGRTHVGGLIGYKDGGTVLRSYSHADVIGYGNNVGGFLGYSNVADTSIRQNLSTGKVMDGTIGKTVTNMGGFLGYGACYSDNFFNVETSGMSVSAGSAVGMGTNDLRKQSTYEIKGWDFDIDFYMKDARLNKGYPENRRFWRYKKGKGTPSDPFLIYTLEELNQVRHFQYAHFRLENDITVDYPTTGKGFMPIGYWGLANNGWYGDSFDGVFDGNGKTIGGLYINRPTEDYIALFRYMRGVVKNLNVVDAKVYGKNNAAGLVGQTSTKVDGSRAEIINCRVIGFNGAEIKGNQYTSGLIGYASYVDITNCLVENVLISGSSTYSSGFVGYVDRDVSISKSASRKCRVMSSAGYVGGFLGTHDYINLTITDCYARNELTGTSDLGGFVSRLYYYSGSSNRNVKLERCLSESYASDGSACPFCNYYSVAYTGGVQVVNCFYDRTLANIAAGVGGAKYTPEMKHPSTFTVFDFVNTWVLDPQYNDGYPELIMFIPIKPPILGFRNQFGDYYTDANGNILRYLEFGTLVAGSTSDALPVWLQNNADFPVKDMKVWVDDPTVAPGITVELSLSNNPFVPTDEIVFGGTVAVGEARKFYVRFSSDVTVTSGGTFDLKAKASPV
jgi:hypothetical protein